MARMFRTGECLDSQETSLGVVTGSYHQPSIMVARLDSLQKSLSRAFRPPPDRTAQSRHRDGAHHPSIDSKGGYKLRSYRFQTPVNQLHVRPRMSIAHLVPIKNSKLNSKSILIPPDVKYQLLVPYRIQLMSDHSSPKHLLAE